MKTCNKCHTEKPLTAYWKRKAALDGYQARCIDCMSTSVKVNPALSDIPALTGDVRKRIFTSAIFRARDYLGWSEESFNATLERVNQLD
jgi:hypothetical protein